VREILNDLGEAPEEPSQKRKRGRPKGTTNKSRMYDRGVIALMTFPTVEAAAEHVGVTRQTSPG
jgi:hypothetical protein